MAENYQYHYYLQDQPPPTIESFKDRFSTERGPSTFQVVAVVTLLPLASFLLLLAGLTFSGTLVGLAVAAPLFVIFSPILVPAALVIALAVAGFLMSGALGITALSSFSWLVNHLRTSLGGLVPEAERHLDHGRRRLQDTPGFLGQKTKDLGQTIQDRAHNGGRAPEVART